MTTTTPNRRGFYAIGIENHQQEQNMGTLLRSAHLMGAAYVFTLGETRYRHQASDTMRSERHMPVMHFGTIDQLILSKPLGAKLVGIEMDDRALPLHTYAHPQSAIYLLGNERFGLTEDAADACDHLVYIPAGTNSLNVATAGSVVAWDRISKLGHVDLRAAQSGLDLLVA